MKDAVYIIHCPPSWVKTPQLSLVYLKNYLQHQKIAAQILDLNILLFKLLAMPQKAWLTLDKCFEEELFSIVQKKFPQVLENLYLNIKNFSCVGFSLTRRNAQFSFLLASKIRDKFPDKKIIFGGPETLSLDWQNRLHNEYYWVIGEGEMPLCSIINHKEQRIYRFQELDDLDTLPFFTFESLHANEYSPVIPLLSSRGCPHQCTFCSEKKLYKKLRHHSAQYMIEQIKLLIQTHKRNHFVFCDSLINYSPRWLEEFCSLILLNNLTIKWEAQIRIDQRMSIELAILMKKSGCINLFVGLESGSDRVLKSMNKGFSVSTALAFFNNLNAAKLQFEISLIFGYPGEDENAFRETLNFIVDNKMIIPKIAQANPFVDYLETFKQEKFPSQEAHNRIHYFLKIMEKEKIKYTKSFINNLVYYA
ncbi:MAG: radical SAM protein [Candidatus Omnitrophota bacterium]